MKINEAVLQELFNKQLPPSLPPFFLFKMQFLFFDYLKCKMIYSKLEKSLGFFFTTNQI